MRLNSPHPTPWRAKVHEVIFGINTRAGQLFDIFLLWTILFSVLVVILESIASVRQYYGEGLLTLEWIFTVLFTIEYILRLISVRHPLKYVFSFFGVIDLLSVLPTYLDLFITGGHSVMILRALRLLRIFRIFKLGRYIKELSILVKALKATRIKITVFFTSVVTLTLIIGTAMYLIEGEEYGFTSIPKSMYWAIVTMTTVGYGDIAPKTVFGQMVASFVMVLGYAIIVVPTGIFSVELAEAVRSRPKNFKFCPQCGYREMNKEARYCAQCGNSLKKGKVK